MARRLLFVAMVSTVLWTLANAFVAPTSLQSPRRLASSASDTTTTSIDPKEIVKLFGRLAEKYIVLDSSGGNCCYSACADCEYRLPGGGYIMADQSAARPKWIPVYDTRLANDKEHTTKWSQELFGENEKLSKEDFVQRVAQLDYAPPLGGPYVGASSADIQQMEALEKLFDVMVDGKPTLTKHKMSRRLQALAGGELGLMWPNFSAALMEE